MAARVDHDSVFKVNSTEALMKLKESSWETICAEIEMSPIKQRLEELQCHFTWELGQSRSILYNVRDRLQDMSTEEDNIYVGHIYNLQGFIHYKLGHTADALQFFTRATKAFRRIRPTLEGPWLLVNYGNLAWLHHELGQQEDTDTYLSNIQALTKELPAVETEDIHPEVLAEKAWSLKEFSKKDQLLAVELFQKALEMEPHRVEWRSSWAIALLNTHKHNETGVDDDILQKVKMAHEQDTGNLNLWAEYLNQRAKRGENVLYEVSELATKVLENPLSNHRVFKTVLWIYNQLDSVDIGILWAEDALKKHPDSRYLKRCLTFCYKWKILYKDGASTLDLIKKAVSLLKEVIALYPDSCLEKEIDLANIYAKSDRSKAEELYQDLLQREMELRDKQMLYIHYAKYLLYIQKDNHGSIKYHEMAARIDHDSVYRVNSMKALMQLKEFITDDVLEKIKQVLELDPDQLSLRVDYLNQRAKRGEDVKNEVTQLAPKVLENPHSSYNEIKSVLLIYKNVFSVDAALDLAKESVEKHPESRHLKMCLALCYKWKIYEMNSQRQRVSQDLIDSATCLLKEVISFHPSLTKEIDLANIYATSNHSFHLADQKYQELLQRDLELSYKQMLYHSYAKFLHFNIRDYVASAEYHMKVVEIPIESGYKAKSIEILERIKTKHDG